MIMIGGFIIVSTFSNSFERFCILFSVNRVLIGNKNCLINLSDFIKKNKMPILRELPRPLEKFAAKSLLFENHILFAFCSSREDHNMHCKLQAS